MNRLFKLASVSTVSIVSVSTLGLLTACHLTGGGDSGTSPLTGSNNSNLTFFVTSVNPGKGGDLGGLAGADAHCKRLASSVGAGNKNWRAYLSTTPGGGAGAVHARERIGAGPWTNAKGAVVARNVSELHSDMNNLNKQTAITEKGAVVSGRGDTPNNHDIMTGSMADGRASDAATDSTCGNWTKGGEGSAIVGHHDRIGLNDSAPMKSWNSSHGSRGCSLDALRATGGGGLFYCFAAN